MTYNVGYEMKGGHIDLVNLESVKLLKIQSEKLNTINEQTQTTLEVSGDTL